MTKAADASFTFEFAEREHTIAFFKQPFFAAEVRQIHHKAAFDYRATRQLDERSRGFRRTARREYVVCEEHPFSRFHRIDVHLDPVLAIFQIVVIPEGLPRQFAFFANRDEPDAETKGERCTDNETPRFDARDFVRFRVGITARE